MFYKDFRSQYMLSTNGQSQRCPFGHVKGTSFAVKTGEVFSLLGVNGAGKTSTFECLVGQSRISGGIVLLDDVSIDEYVGQPQRLHGLVGYCPQRNIFDGYLTVKQ